MDILLGWTTTRISCQLRKRYRGTCILYIQAHCDIMRGTLLVLQDGFESPFGPVLPRHDGERLEDKLDVANGRNQDT